MADPVILAVDQGTTNTKALLIGPDGVIRAQVSLAMLVSYPHPGWAELDAREIWKTVAGVIADVVARAGGREIAAVGISNQRESILLWDAESGAPVGPCVLWQCRRSAARCQALREAGHEAEIVARTGLGLDPLFPATKLAWLLDTVPGARKMAARGVLRAGTVDSWLIWNFTGGRHVTDVSNASRTQLFNLQTLSWDPELAALFDIPPGILPDILPSDGTFGTLKSGVTALPGGIPIRAAMGDSHAALFGHGVGGPGPGSGFIKATCGTGSSLMMVTDSRIVSRHGLSSTIAWGARGRVLHALEGNILVSGQTAAFATRLLGLKDPGELTEMAQSVEDSDGVVLVPALSGLGAPHWCDYARGMVSGMSLGTKPAHVARAALEAIALQIRDVFAAMEADLGAKLPSLSVDGGATRNGFLMQLIADLIGRPVLRGPVEEVGALGAARMACEALGLAAPAGAEGGKGTEFVPTMPPDRRDTLIADWQDAVARAKFRPLAER